MEKQECQMIMLKVLKRGRSLPIAKVIVIVPDKTKAKEYAIEELKAHIPDQTTLPHKDHYMFMQENLGGILFEPVPTTVFLYTEEAGVIKK